jgi:predicted PurR-regulated permease PerM
MTPRENSKEKTPAGGYTRVLRIELTPFTMVMAVLVAGATWLLIKLLPAFLVLVGALMLVGTLNPVVEWLERRRIRRHAGIVIVFGALLVAIFLLITLTVPAFVDQVKSLIDHAPALRARLLDILAGSPLTAPLATGLRNLQYDALIKSAVPAVLTFSTRAIEVLAYTAAAIFLALYIMIDCDRLRRALFAIVPRRHHRHLSHILLKLQTIVGGYIRGQVITSALIALFIFAVLTFLGIPDALAIAVFGGIADALPVVGIFLTMIPAVLAALAKSQVAAAIVFVLILCYEEFEGRVLIPLVYGRALRLPSSVVLFSLLAGGVLGGIVGALLALPVASALLMLMDELEVELPGEEANESRAEGMPAERSGKDSRAEPLD